MVPAVTNKEVVVTEGDKLTNVQRLGKLLAASNYFADAREQAQAAVKVMAGEELGIPPIASMMGIHIIKGKVVLSANLIASRIRAHRYEYRFKHFDAQKCSIEFLSKPDESGKRIILGESSFTISDAVQAGIKSDMYAKYPRNMLFARAVSNGARWFVPDVFSGLPVYTPGELGEVVEESEESAPHVEVPEEPKQDQPKQDQPKPLTSFAERLATYTRQKERVGKDAYYEVLGAHGYEHANEVCKRPVEERQAIYHELLALPDIADTAQQPEEL